MNPKTLLATLTLLAATVIPATLIAACGGDAADVAAADDTRRATIRVETAVSERLSSPRVLEVTGDLEPLRRVSPGTKLIGRVVAVPFAAGDRVRRGDLLVGLDSADLEAAMDQARAGLAMAEAQLANAAAQHRRMRELEARGSATAKSLEDAEAGRRIAEASVAQARAALAASEVTLQYALVRSPFDGWVTATHVEPGDMATPGTPLVTVEDLSQVEAVFAVQSSDLVALNVGDPIDVEVASQRRPAVITHIVPAGDTASRSFRVEAVLDNPDGALRSGMFVRARLVRGEELTLWLPESAIVDRGQLDGIFVVSEAREGPVGRARLRWVTLGSRREGQVEVLSGLEPGERYVVFPPSELTDGSPVEVAP